VKFGTKGVGVGKGVGVEGIGEGSGADDAVDSCEGVEVVGSKRGG